MSSDRAAVIECDLTDGQRENSALADRMVAMANELVEPMLCKTPGYGYPGAPGGHCAACCYGTGVVITCKEEQAIYDAAMALHRAASGIYANVHQECCGRTQ